MPDAEPHEKPRRRSPLMPDDLANTLYEHAKFLKQHGVEDAMLDDFVEDHEKMQIARAGSDLDEMDSEHAVVVGNKIRGWVRTIGPVQGRVEAERVAEIVMRNFSDGQNSLGWKVLVLPLSPAAEYEEEDRLRREDEASDADDGSDTAGGA